jgi:hypothetical protein
MRRKIAELECQQANDGKVAGVAAFLKAGSANALFSSIDKVCPSPRAKSKRSSESR